MASYGEKLDGVATSSCVGFALSMVKETGILQVLLDAERPLTSQEVADRKELKERYVRELLNCLTTAELIHASTDEAGSLVYHIQEDEKQAFKTSVMPFISFLTGFASVFNTIKGCIPISGPYGTRLSEEVHNVVEDFSMCHLDLHVEGLVGRVEGLKARLESGIEVLEVGCGRGPMLAKLASMFPKSTFTATDNVPSLLDQLKIRLDHIPNIKYEILDLCCQHDQPARQYDLIYCVDVIHDLPNPLEALKGIRNSLKSDGVLTIIEILTSGSPISDRGNLSVACLYAASTFFCIPESFQKEDSLAYGACWGKNLAIDVITAAGFHVNAIDLERNFVLYICKM